MRRAASKPKMMAAEVSKNPQLKNNCQISDSSAKQRGGGRAGKRSTIIVNPRRRRLEVNFNSAY
jgi:hypothetical protein